MNYRLGWAIIVFTIVTLSNMRNTPDDFVESNPYMSLFLCLTSALLLAIGVYLIVP